MLKPMNNNVLIELENESQFVVGVEKEGYETGILRAVPEDEDMFYLASNSWAIESSYGEVEKAPLARLRKLIGKQVSWEQYAERGNTIQEDDKTYVLVNFTKLIAFKE